METSVIDPEVGSEQKTPIKQKPTLSVAGRTLARWEPNGTDTMISTARGSAETRSKSQPLRMANLATTEPQEYDLGSPIGRVAMLMFLVGFGLIPFLAGDPPFLFGLIWGAISFVGAWQTLKSPYIVRVGRDWAEFESLIGTQHARADEFIYMVRNVLPSSGELHHLDIELSNGSITVDGNEGVFEALKQMNPALRWTTQEYDDSD